MLAIDPEGAEVCEWLTSMALEDAQRTLGLVRFHAANWHIDAHRIGVLRFSAGGHLVAAVSTHFERRLYPAVDATDKVSCRSDFAIALYPGHIWNYDEKKLGLDPELHFTKQTPPTFIVQAENDDVDSINRSLGWKPGLEPFGWSRSKLVR